jgi:hypothetical protein
MARRVRGNPDGYEDEFCGDGSEMENAASLRFSR